MLTLMSVPVTVPYRPPIILARMVQFLLFSSYLISLLGPASEQLTLSAGPATWVSSAFISLLPILSVTWLALRALNDVSSTLLVLAWTPPLRPLLPAVSRLFTVPHMVRVTVSWASVLSSTGTIVCEGYAWSYTA